MASFNEKVEILMVGQLIKLDSNIRRDVAEESFRKKAAEERNARRRFAYEKAAEVLQLIGAHRGRLVSINHGTNHILTIKCAFNTKAQRDQFTKAVS